MVKKLGDKNKFIQKKIKVEIKSLTPSYKEAPLKMLHLQ